MKRILVIRGGAIGDFILTLPALGALRNAYPHAHIEILGYKHIAALAEGRFYAQAVRSIEYGPLSSFFAKNSEPPPELADHFASFDLIVSYLYDPDRIFETNLRRCGVENLVCGSAKIDPPKDGFAVASNGIHAARQLSRPMEELGLPVGDFAPKLYPSAQDRQFAREFLRDIPSPVVAIHPGSGSEKKNWPIENWIELALTGEYGRAEKRPSLIVISGEADEPQRARLENEWEDRSAKGRIRRGEKVRFAKDLPLPRLAAVLEDAIFIGHDSGISHLAAAAGADCILLFGPTDPEVWAPLNKNVKVLCGPGGDLRQLDVDLVHDEVAQALMRIGINT